MNEISPREEIAIKIRGRFILTIFETFSKWTGPKGQKFGNQFLGELMTGKLAAAWEAEVASDAEKEKQLQAALENNKTLTDLNAKLTAAQGQATGIPVATPITTPNGYTLDQADLATVDAIIAKHNVPNPAVQQP